MQEASLFRLVYHSRNLIAGDRGAFLDEVHQILAASRRNNQRAGITGALMFNRGCFAQVLEGPRAAVEATFERIQLDERHAGVMLMDIAEIARRGFPTWSMAFVGEIADDDPRLSDIQAQSGFEPGHLSGERLFALLRELVMESGWITV